MVSIVPIILIPRALFTRVIDWARDLLTLLQENERIDMILICVSSHLLEHWLGFITRPNEAGGEGGARLLRL